MKKRLYVCAASFLVLTLFEIQFMFSFGKKEFKSGITDRIFISTIAKTNAIIEKVHHHSNLIIITWFDDSFRQLEDAIRSGNPNVEIYSAKQIAAHDIQNKDVLFFEHYPLASKEDELLEKLQLRDAVFYSALDEPLFQHFGSDKIISLMQKMGFSENEAIEHSMVSNAIRNGQEKISKEIIVEHSAQSQTEWFSKNLVKP